MNRMLEGLHDAAATIGSVFQTEIAYYVGYSIMMIVGSASLIMVLLLIVSLLFSPVLLLFDTWKDRGKNDTRPKTTTFGGPG